MNDYSVRFSIVDIVRKHSVDTSEVVSTDRAFVSWGRENRLPTLYRSCYEGSSTLKAAIDASVGYVIGDGVQAAGRFGTSINRNKATIEDVVRFIARDYYVFGGFAIQVMRNRLGEVVELYPLDVAKCRLSGDGKTVLYNKAGWGRGSRSVRFPRFGCGEDRSASEIYFYNAGGISRVYNLPEWHSALVDVLTEIECANYALNSVGSGFSARYILNIPSADNLTNEQQTAIEAAIKEKFTGAETDVNFMLFWQAAGVAGIDVKKIEADDTPERFIAIKNNARANIFTSLRISPLLCGLAADTSTGFSTQEFSDSFALYNRTIVSGVQKILVSALNKIIGEDRVTVRPFKIDFK